MPYEAHDDRFRDPMAQADYEAGRLDALEGYAERCTALMRRAA